MKPLMLHGHERSITQIKYNRDGDLLFSAAKDTKPNVWYSLNGERLGTYNGHGGAVWCIDVDFKSSEFENVIVNGDEAEAEAMEAMILSSGETKHFISGSADNSLRFWDCETATTLSKYETKTSVRACGFSFCGKQIMMTTDRQMGHECILMLYDVREGSKEPYLNIPIEGPKVTAALWGPLDQNIITGHENGDLCQWDTKTGNKLLTVHEHSKQINDIQVYKDQTMFVTASKDHTAKLFDTNSLRLMNTYKTERPVNSASLSPIREHVVLGGGQEAMDVTTTSARIGKFDARFFHTVFEEEIGRVKGHFGPINSTAFHPDGKSYSSGGEDGYVRVHVFDPSYFELEFEY